jgi:ectoine hydroxylase-related dioxygenase (phytanoyl-CoA dioxygenase family)
MVNKEFLLNTKQMAEFTTNGYLVLEGVVPKDLCDAALKEMETRNLNNFDRQGLPFNYIWNSDKIAIGKVFRLPIVEGMIQSLVGPNPRYDHHFPHLNKANSRVSENLHQDAELDPRFENFDIQISFFPTDVNEDGGGTLFVPGSHFRRVHESTIRRYQNIVGQVQSVCKAGTIVVWHHNIWHSSRSNHSNKDRYMFKLRLNPTVRQQLLWNTDDLNNPEALSILKKGHKWHGQAARVEEMNRIRFWRHITNQPNFDMAGYYWSRIENKPDTFYDFNAKSSGTLTY